MTSSLNHKSIIIITNTLFYPARRNGTSIRYYPLINELHNLGYIVDIIVINKYRERFSERDIGALKKVCRAIDIFELCKHTYNNFNKLGRHIANLLYLLNPSGIPYSRIDNCRQNYLSRVSALLECRHRYDYGIGVGGGGNNAKLLISLKDNIKPEHILCDFIDSSYLLRKRKNVSSSFNPITLMEDAKTRRWELSLCKNIGCIYISDIDAKSVKNANAHIVPNCVIKEGYDSSENLHLDTPNIGFLGNMSYQPNIDACLFLATSIFPRLRKLRPDIHLYIIGRNPAKELIKHCEDSQIHITGEVENIWDYVRSINTFVFPMLTGAGLQNKILEAMYAGKPVVTSTIGNEGIGATHGENIYIAKTLDDYVNYTIDAITNKSIGNHANAFIENNYSARNVVNRYIQALESR